MFINKIREGYHHASRSEIPPSLTTDSLKSRLLATGKSAAVSADVTTETAVSSSGVDALGSESSMLPFAMSEKDTRNIQLTKAYEKVMYIRDLLGQLRQIQREQKSKNSSNKAAVTAGMSTGELTYLRTGLLTHWLTHSLTHSLTYSLTHSLTHLLTYSLTHSLCREGRVSQQFVGCDEGQYRDPYGVHINVFKSRTK